MFFNTSKLHSLGILVFVLFVTSQILGQKPKTSKIHQLNDIALYYEVYGDGPPLLLLHGWTQSSQFWKPYITELSQHYKVYVPDLRGHGKTTPLSGNFSIQLAAGDLSEFMNSFDLQGARAIGLSFGGLLLLELSYKNPELFNAMILIGATYNYDGADNKALNEEFSFEKLPPAFVEELRKNHPQGDDQIKALFNPSLDYKIALSVDDLKRIPTRTLIIHGDSDEILGTEPAVNLHKGLANSALWIIPNTGHIAIDEENKSEFLRLSLQFLAKEVSTGPKRK